jgi:hypothetical protein
MLTLCNHISSLFPNNIGKCLVVKWYVADCQGLVPSHIMSVHLFILHTHKKSSVCVFAKRQYLTWIGDPLFMAANSPSSQVPCLKSTALAPLAFSITSRTSFPPIEHLFYVKTTLTSPILLSDTLIC